jgi:hypothetical protein
MRLYSRNPREDENRLLRGDGLQDYSNYPLRQSFIHGDDDTILTTVWKFFLRVAETWPDQWSEENQQSVLVKTTGYAALVEVLRRWLNSPRSAQVLRDDGVRESLFQIRDYYARRENRFARTNYAAGNQGVIKQTPPGSSSLAMFILIRLLSTIRTIFASPMQLF